MNCWRCGEKPLGILCFGMIGGVVKNHLVTLFPITIWAILRTADFITNSNDWDTNLLNITVNSNALSIILSTLIPKWSSLQGTPCWVLSSNGNFSVKSVSFFPISVTH